MFFQNKTVFSVLFLIRLSLSVLILPVEVFSPVPNLSLVNLNRISSLPQFIPREPLEIIRLLDYDYSSSHSQKPICSEEEMMTINWRDYEQVKSLFVIQEDERDTAAKTIAIHWWQRSWQ
jgi:hypothetical protein